MSADNDLYFDKDCPLEAVVSLAEPRDVGGLNSAFQSILVEHIPDRAIKVYEVVSTVLYPSIQTVAENNLRLILETREELHLADIDLEEEDVMTCILNNKVVSGVSGVDGTTRTLFPIPGLTKALGVLVIAGETDTSFHNFLDPLLRIYASHAFLLNRNERDSLTGLYNRQALNTKLRQIYQREEAKQRKNDDKKQQWCLAVLDIDHFKNINDNFGHVYGDEILTLFSQLLEHSFRDDDMLFRYGGEEFVILLKNVDLEKAVNILNRFREQIAATEFPTIGHITASIGYTMLDTQNPIPVIIDRADQALYFSKNHGRNRTSGYEDLVRRGEIPLNPLQNDNITHFPKQSIH
ncbi:MAG: GGDEF domain-containing protein [Gammaproteobacteria bacterium]|nr:GGDEF domain-containing protein [Gammaproteobacteria bacterium]MDH5652274.1 GGDEF domain-containing protein [Gammaproteobacteria bacterium]